jgi:hypothetical protein
MKARTILTAAVLGTASLAHAAAPTDFSCRNTAAQIACEAATCEVETESFTPMGVSRTGNRLEVCAYTSCQSGPLDLIRTRGDLTILHAKLAGGQGAVSVTYDRKQKIATMLWGNYAQAMSCGDGA